MNPSNSNLFGQPNNVFGNNNAFGTTGQNTPFMFGSQSQQKSPLFGQTPASYQPQQSQPGYGFGSSLIFNAPSLTPDTSTMNICSATTSFGHQPLKEKSSGTLIRFTPNEGTDTMPYKGALISVNTKQNCISLMSEYEDKSMEELRFEDYSANRKGGAHSSQFDVSAELFAKPLAPLFGGAKRNTGMDASGSQMVYDKSDLREFGSVTSSAKPFGFTSTTTTSAASVFNFTNPKSSDNPNPFCFKNPTSENANAFGLTNTVTSNDKAFGFTNQNTTNANSNIFGFTNTNPTKTNANAYEFTNTNTIASNSKPFGFGNTTTPLVNTNAFGFTNANTTIENINAFGFPKSNTNTTAANTNLFGFANTNTPIANTNAFGFNTTNTTMANPNTFGFANTSTANSNPFGFANAPAANTNAFGFTNTNPIITNKQLFGPTNTNTAINTNAFEFRNPNTSNLHPFGFTNINTKTANTNAFGFTNSKPITANTNAFGFTNPSTTSTNKNVFCFTNTNTTSPNTNAFGYTNTASSLFGNNLLPNPALSAQPLEKSQFLSGIGSNHLFGQTLAQPKLCDVFNNTAPISNFATTTPSSFNFGNSSLSVPTTTLYPPTTNTGVSFMPGLANTSSIQPKVPNFVNCFIPGQQLSYVVKHCFKGDSLHLYKMLDTCNPFGYSPHLYGLTAIESDHAKQDVSPNTSLGFLYENTKNDYVRNPPTKTFCANRRLKHLPNPLIWDIFDDNIPEEDVILKRNSRKLVLTNNVSGKTDLPTIIGYSDRVAIDLNDPPISIISVSTSTDSNVSTNDKSWITPEKHVDFLNESQLESENDLIDTCGIICTRLEYYTLPPLHEISKYKNKDGSCFIKGFTVGRIHYGNVHFPDVINVSNLNIDEIVYFGPRELTIYPDDSKKPPIGEGLNRCAQITLERVYPKKGNSNEVETDPTTIVAMNYAAGLRAVCLKHNTSFIAYRPETGSWVFEVKHFSKYGINSKEDNYIKRKILKFNS